MDRLHPLWLNYRGLLVVLTIAAVTYLTALGSARLWDRDEPRNAQCAREMYERGDWLVPTFGGELRTHKPILLYWMQLTAYQLVGVNEWGARLPSALCGLLAVACAYGIARRLTDSATAFWTGIVLATSTMFVVASRAATPDAPLIACGTLAVYLAVCATERSLLRDAKAWPTWSDWCGVYAACGAAVLAKGPVGLVLPGTVIGLWLIYLSWPTHQVGKQTSDTFGSPTQRFMRRASVSLVMFIRHAFVTAWRMRPWTALAVVLFVAGQWYVAVGLATDGVWLKEFFFTHNVSRAVTPMEGHRGPPVLFYLIALAIGTFPWSLWLLPMASQLKQRWQVDPKFRPAMMLGLAWIAVYIVVFSIAATKLPSYITPCYPGAALLIGAMLARWIRNQENSVNWIQAGLLIAVVVGLGIGISAGAINIRGQHLTAPLAPAGTLLAIASLGAIWLVSRRRVDLGIRLYTAGAVAMVISLASLAPMLVDRSRTELETIARAQTVSPEVAFVGEVEPSWIFYSQGTAHCLQDADWQAAAVEFLNTSTARALITNRAQANELKAHLYATHPSLQLEEQRNPGEDLVVVRIHPAPTGLAQRDGRRY